MKTHTRLGFSFLTLLVLIWLIFSSFDNKHLYFGLLAIMLSYNWCKKILFISTSKNKFYIFDLNWIALAEYMLWLCWQIFIANIHVAKIILSNKNDLDPQVMIFKSDLKHPLAKSLLANSITLTPGTITLNVFADNFEVHALNEEFTHLIKVGELNKKIAKIFKVKND